MSSYELPATAAKPVAPAVVPVRRSLNTRWISTMTLVALLAIWWGVTASGWIEPLFLPPPSAVLQ
jgi:taurine transport system permease protein